MTNRTAPVAPTETPVVPAQGPAKENANSPAKSSDRLRKKLSQLMPQSATAQPSQPAPQSTPAKPQPSRANSQPPQANARPNPVADVKPVASPPPQENHSAAPTPNPSPASPANTPSVNQNSSGRSKTGRIMIVDDEETNILTVEAYLQQSGYRDFVSTMESRDALNLISSSRPDLLLLDINMPHVSGIDILRSLSCDKATKHIPVIVLTAATNTEVKQQALSLGATDFLTKPVDPHDLVPRVRNALIIKQHMDEMANQNAKLEELVKRRTKDLFDSRQQLILSLARAAEHRDDDTGNHVIRVGRYAGLIAKELGWSAQRVLMIEQAAQLHDVGKIGIPDSILFKKDKLDPTEWELMRQHCAIGSEIIEPLGGKELEKLRSHSSLGAEILHMRTSPMMMMATRIAQTHHEWWDGTGYPLGLAGNDIPIEGRITAVADVFDALSSARTYKPAFPRQKCFDILEEGRATHFDPAVLDAFFNRSEEIIRVQLALMDRKS